MKTCFKCGVSKPVDEFYRHPQMGDGLLGKCKECTKADVKARYYSKHDEVMAYEKRRLRDPKRVSLRNGWYQANKKRGRELALEYIRRYPDKRAATVAVGNAVRDGRLKKKPCEICGRPDSQAHHEDYSMPLEVIWMCSTCHAAHHKHKRAVEKFWQRVQSSAQMESASNE